MSIINSLLALATRLLEICYPFCSSKKLHSHSHSKKEDAVKEDSLSNRGNLAVEGIRPDAHGKVVKMHMNSTDQIRGQR